VMRPTRPVGTLQAMTTIAAAEQVEQMLRDRAALPAGHPDRERLRDRAVRACLPLARRLARQHAGRGEALDDLYQVAAMALVRAVDAYEPERGEFDHYVVPCIRGELKRHFRNNGWSMRVPRSLQELSLRVTAAIGEVSQQQAHTATIADIASHLGVSSKEVLIALDAAHTYRLPSLNRPPAEGHGELIDLVGQHDRGYQDVDNHLVLRPLIRALPPLQRQVVTLRYFGRMTQPQISAAVGISQTHVSRLLAEALRRLRAHLFGEYQGAA
jgi:RNA polymerase sigma-B factor